jgi:ATP-dependent DNA helicase PIF1
MSKFPGEERLYRSFDTLEEEQHLFLAEFINTLTPSGVPPHELYLKVGAPIMLMRNFHPFEGHCNGTKYVIRRLHDRIIEAEIAGGPYRGNTLLIPRIKIKPSEQTFPFQMCRKQFPVRPCFAITSNKAQGQTLQRVAIYLDRHFFSHGSYYVAQSRVGDDDELKIVSLLDAKATQNVVYPEILY